MDKEIRGRRYYIWFDFGGILRFTPPMDSTNRVTITAPLSWHLEPDPEEGVVLRDVCDNTLTAEQFYEQQLKGRPGFNVVSED